MLLRDKSGGPLLNAEWEPAIGSGPPLLMADNGRKSFEIDTGHANFYRLISATKGELAQLQKAGFKMDTAADFEPREG